MKDIDINRLTKAFDIVVNRSDYFTHYDRDDRGNKTEHYRFYYRSFFGELDESYILLDVSQGENPYSELIKVPIRSPILITEEPLTYVTVPSVNCLLADKFTAFAPETIGISITAEPDNSPKRVEVLKQMYDINLLFLLCDNLAMIRETYYNVAQIEIEARDAKISPEDALLDTWFYAKLLGFEAGKKRINMNN